MESKCLLEILGNRDRKNGFTLIELLVVIFIIGVSSALAGAVLFRSNENVILKTFGREVASSLRYARIRAVAEKKIYSFVMYKDEKICALYGENVSEDQKDGLWVKVSDKKFPEGITLEKSDNQNMLRIDFFPEGESTGGEIKLRSLNGSSLQITVEQISGRVMIEKVQS